MLNGIDISSFQTGIDVSRISCNFIISKATQGTSYINPDFNRQASGTLNSNKLLGIYHYASGGDPVKEADFFLKVIAGFVGKATLWLDWEREQNSLFGKNDVDWCYRFCSRVKARTGVTPGIYMSKLVCRAHDWKKCSSEFPLWVAQYANNEITSWQKNPWTDSGGYGSWKAPIVFQYTSKGRINGWSKNLDLDIAYMSPEEWSAMAKGKKPPATSTTVLFPDKTDNDLAVEVMFGKHGANDKREKALGNRYNAVQKEVDKYYESITKYQVDLLAYLKKHGCGGLL